MRWFIYSDIYLYIFTSIFCFTHFTLFAYKYSIIVIENCKTNIVGFQGRSQDIVKRVAKVWNCLLGAKCTISAKTVVKFIAMQPCILSWLVFLTWGWISLLVGVIRTWNMILVSRSIYLSWGIQCYIHKDLNITHSNNHVQFLPKRSKIGSIKARDMIFVRKVYILEPGNSMVHLENSKISQ